MGIHDWSDGKRVIGLSNAQIMKRYDEITAVFKKDRNFNKHLNSPYAKPSHWGIAELKRDIAENKRNRRAANNAFESYCNPFVVSPWVPTPNPTSWKVSTFAPVGRAIPRQGAYRK